MVRVTSPAAATDLVDVEVYDPTGAKVSQAFWDRQSFSAKTAKSFYTSVQLSSNSKTGTWTVKVGVFTPRWGGLLSWTNSAATFAVK